MLSERTANPFAPPYLNGCNPGAPDGFVDVSYDYPFTYVFPANNAGVQLLGQQVTIGTDADFCWRGLIGFMDLDCAFRFADSRGYYLSDNYVGAFAINMAFNFFPYVIFPEMVFPAGSRIVIDIQNGSSANANRIQLLFRGVKRFRVAQAG